MFGKEWKTTNEIKLEDKLLFLTEKISTIKAVLSKLGFKCSNHSVEEHPLSLFIVSQDEKAIFEKNDFIISLLCILALLKKLLYLQEKTSVETH